MQANRKRNSFVIGGWFPFNPYPIWSLSSTQSFYCLSVIVVRHYFLLHHHLPEQRGEGAGGIKKVRLCGIFALFICNLPTNLELITIIYRFEDVLSCGPQHSLGGRAGKTLRRCRKMINGPNGHIECTWEFVEIRFWFSLIKKTQFQTPEPMTLHLIVVKLIAYAAVAPAHSVIHEI